MKGKIVADTPDGFIVQFQNNLFVQITPYILKRYKICQDTVDIPLNYLDSCPIIDFS